MEQPHVNQTIAIIKKHLAGIESNEAHVYASSSFQTQSVPLLHILKNHFPEVKIVFIDTGFLFAETYAFKNLLVKELGLDVVTVRSTKSYMDQAGTALFQYAEDTAYCCYINKVEPIDALIKSGDVWISGVRRDQTAVRKSMNEFEVDKRGIVRIHPMLDWNSKNVYDYINAYDLPKHPLESAGYMSIGCVPCTHKYSEDGARGGRWVGSAKTECGLHTNNR